MRVVRAYTRMFLLALTMVFYLLLIIGRQLLMGKNQAFAFRIRRKWIKLACKILSLEIEIQGSLPSETGLIISNHRSMIDPVVILSYVYAVPLGKAEISDYPLIGNAAKATGIIFVDREDRKSRTGVRKTLEKTLKRNISVLVFPEGTTGTQPLTKTFKKGSFEIASKLHLPVFPVAIDYEDYDNLWKEGDSLMKHYIKSFGKSSSKAYLFIGSPIKSPNSWTLLRDTQAWIDQSLIEKEKSWNLQTRVHADKN